MYNKSTNVNDYYVWPRGKNYKHSSSKTSGVYHNHTLIECKSITNCLCWICGRIACPCLLRVFVRFQDGTWSRGRGELGDVHRFESFSWNYRGTEAGKWYILLLPLLSCLYLCTYSLFCTRCFSFFFHSWQVLFLSGFRLHRRDTTPALVWTVLLRKL